MVFVDQTAHFFEMKSYSDIPIGYEYETTPYVFWFDQEYSNKLSIGNYYVLPIRFIGYPFYDEIKISLDSDIFKLCQTNDIYNGIEIDEANLVNEITLNNINVINGLKLNADLLGDFNDDFNFDYYNYIGNSITLYTFYVFAKANEEGSWLSNIIIETRTLDEEREWCPITIGGSFVDESEELVINAQNIGVDLSKDILKAVYQESFYNDGFDCNLYNIKLKEYLMNHMLLKSECGNYNSVIGALKWFGWGDHIELSKLLKTDNEFLEQYIHDYFSTNEDILDSFKLFKNTSYIALTVYDNRETGDIYEVDSDDSLWGEGKPILEDLFNKTIEVETNNPDIKFIKNYYDYMFNELSLKLSCLAYMYKKYFLPIHLSIHSASIEHKVFANDIKLMQVTSVSSTEVPVITTNRTRSFRTNVEFNDTNSYFLYNNPNVYIDDNYNRFNKYDKDYCEQVSNIDFYFVDNNISAEIPIKFKTYSNNEQVNGTYDCVLILSRNNEPIHESHFMFSDEYDNYKSFVIVPRIFGHYTDKEFWEDNKFRIDLLCNGVWYSKEFILKIPEFNINFGTLKYKYEQQLQKQIRSISGNFIDFNANIFTPELVTFNDANFMDTITRAYTKTIGPIFCNHFNDSFSIFKQYPDLMKYIISSNEQVKITDHNKYLNRVYVYDLTDKNGHIIKFEDTKAFNHENKTDKFEFEQSTMNLYNDFFNNTGTPKCEIDNNYDFYLMHNNKRYYVVLISKNTVDNLSSDETLDHIIEFGNYILKKYKYNDTFLINRMVYKPIEDGKNHFDKDDIIVATLENIELPFIMSLGTKWEFIKRSIGTNPIEAVTSKTNYAIVDVPAEYEEYVSGYYDVKVNYSIDDFYQHNKMVIGKILIR